MTFQSSLVTLKSSLQFPLASTLTQSFVRYASLNSAIGRGIRRTQRLENPATTSNSRSDRSQVGRAFIPANAGTRRSQAVGYPRNRFSNNQDRTSTGRARYPSQEFTDGRRFQDMKNPRDRPKNIETPWIGHDRSSEAERNPLTLRENPRGKGYRNRAPDVEFDEDEFIRTGNFRALPREHQRSASVQRFFNPRDSSAMNVNRNRSTQRQDSSHDLRRKARPGRAEAAALHKATDQTPERVREHVKVPDTIPYTTPASEFIYGTAAVEAALRCSRRQLYKLYIYQAADEELSNVKVTLRKLAFMKNVKVKMAFAEWDRLLDKMSAGRPHNGCVLEASPLPRTPIQALKTVNMEANNFQLELAPQTREEALVNGLNDRITINYPFEPQHKRQPVVVMLDGIVDPGNLGAIIRSAYYLGVDAVVFAGRNSAPLSPVMIKSSAGAAENMTLLDVKNEVDFIQRSKANGWRFYAADAPNADSIYVDQASINHDELIGHAPSVIMMGNEGSGLSNHIRSQADSVVSIPGARLVPGAGAASDPARVDSLNVSVASALLMEKFLRVPLGVSAVPGKNDYRR
ncbi:Alpha/beta knot methyltransferase [Aspergillus heterothallicus]